MTTKWTIRRFAPESHNGTAQWTISDNGGIVCGPVTNLTALLAEFGDVVLTAFESISKEVTEA